MCIYIVITIIIVFYIYIYVCVRGIQLLLVYNYSIYTYMVLAVGQNPGTLLFSKIAGIRRCSFPGHFIGFDQSPFIIALYK